MEDLFEPLRERLRQLGWKTAPRMGSAYWIRPDGVHVLEAEAFRLLPPVEDTPVLPDG